MSRILPLAAGAAVQPVISSVLGYQFEAASMIAGLSACLMVRVWISLKNRATHVLALDLTVTGISLLFTAGWIVLRRPEPFYALLSGTGFGALGAGVIVIALSWVKRMEPLALDPEEGSDTGTGESVTRFAAPRRPAERSDAS